MRSTVINTSPIRKKAILKIYREKSNIPDAYLKNLLPNTDKGTSK